MHITELFDKPSSNPTKWQISSNHTYALTTLSSGKPLRTSFYMRKAYDRDPDDPEQTMAFSKVVIVFAVDSILGITGSGEQFEVFSTVAANIKQWLTNQRHLTPVFITFTAESDEPSRVKLYSRLASRIPGYKNITDSKELWPQSMQDDDNEFESQFVLIKASELKTPKLSSRLHQQHPPHPNINELFDKASNNKIDFIDHNRDEATALVRLSSGDKLKVNFTCFPAEAKGDHSSSYCDIEFSINERYKIVPSTVPFEIFATVSKIVQEWVSKRKPEYIKFTSDNGEPSREKMYARLINRIPGYKNITDLDRDTYWPPRLARLYTPDTFSTAIETVFVAKRI